MSVKLVWDFVKEVDELSQYFPDYKGKQCPDRDHLFTILATSRGDVLDSLIEDARKKRSIHEEPDVNQYVEITKELKLELSKVFAQKSKHKIAYYTI